MAEKRTRRRFTAEVKAQAVKRLLEDGKPLADIALTCKPSPGSSLCHAALLGCWGSLQNPPLQRGKSTAQPELISVREGSNSALRRCG